MTVEALKFINDTLLSVGINYEFGEWSSDEIPDTYFIGEFIEVPNPNEDGTMESSFIITGTNTTGSWLELMEAKEIIEGLFPSVGGHIESDLINSHSMAIFFENSFNVPTDTMDLKRLQINLLIKEWKG